ncbi:HD domain-containing protein [Comamonadaceae bacterium SL12-8]|uniref:HD domain-containing protein n=2 Tax=Amphibiibacter pelophylacis TaxID=1799477 RepID=A0ACC6P4Q0_9BURK
MNASDSSQHAGEAPAASAGVLNLPETRFALTAGDTPEAALERARQLAGPLLAGQVLDTGEDSWQHACGVSDILHSMGASDAMRAAAYLVYVAPLWQQPQELITRHFGASWSDMVMSTIRLIQIQRQARVLGTEGDLDASRSGQGGPAGQIERVRKMLLAFSQDLRVVLLRLASRLQTLRYFASQKIPCPQALARESQEVFAPLANRLGIWQIKWELEDLSFRFLNPQDYHAIARQLDEKRVQREADVVQMVQRLQDVLGQAGVVAQVAGRPKHIYSIWKKMQGKRLDFGQVYDVRAFRVIVADVPACYAALAALQSAFESLPAQFKDYIARPKPNGYQSLHLVLRCGQGRPMEVQVRTVGMHDHAEFGVAAHWAYKEAGTKGYAGVVAAGEFEDRVAQARKSVLGQLLAWERDLASAPGAAAADAGAESSEGGRVYVFTPDARLVELSRGSTPVDFAYAVHTELGHRCRGARVDGVMVALTTPLRQGQTVEIVAAKEGGPSRDWLNPEAAYLGSARARAKVRAWFNLQNQQQTQARGREVLEKLLQREGRTAINLEQLAAGLGFRSAEKLFEVIGKDELSIQQVAQFLRPSPVPPPASQELPPEGAVQDWAPRRAAAPRRRSGARGDVLVVGIDSMLTTLAGCCHPAPPDAISGFVTRGQGVAVHRSSCRNLQQMVQRSSERVIEVQWDERALAAPEPGSTATSGRAFAVQLCVLARERAQLMRDVVDFLTRQRVHVTQITSRRERQNPQDVRLHLMVETRDTRALQATLKALAQIDGVRHASRL